MEDSHQSREHGMALLAHRGKIPADAAKSGDPSPDSRKVPEIYCRTFAMRRSRSATKLVLGDDNVKLVRKCNQNPGRRQAVPTESATESRRSGSGYCSSRPYSGRGLCK